MFNPLNFNHNPACSHAAGSAPLSKTSSSKNRFCKTKVRMKVNLPPMNLNLPSNLPLLPRYQLIFASIALQIISFVRLNGSDV